MAHLEEFLSLLTAQACKGAFEETAGALGTTAGRSGGGGMVGSCSR